MEPFIIVENRMFDKYKALFRKPRELLDLNNPLIQFVARQRSVYPNDDMFGTLEYLDNLLDGKYSG